MKRPCIWILEGIDGSSIQPLTEVQSNCTSLRIFLYGKHLSSNLTAVEPPSLRVGVTTPYRHIPRDPGHPRTNRHRHSNEDSQIT